jgi:hypothetical protein
MHWCRLHDVQTGALTSNSDISVAVPAELVVTITPLRVRARMLQITSPAAER